MRQLFDEKVTASVRFRCRPEEAEQGIGVGGGGRLVLLQFVSW